VNEEAAPAAGQLWLRCERPAPQATEPLAGMVRVEGWALATHGIRSVEALVDGEVVAQAIHGFIRRDIERSYPGIEHAVRCGFRAFVDTGKYPPGLHLLTVRATGRDGTTLSESARVTFARAKETGSEFGFFADQAIRYQLWLQQNRVTPEDLAAAASAFPHF